MPPTARRPLRTVPGADQRVAADHGQGAAENVKYHSLTRGLHFLSLSHEQLLPFPRPRPAAQAPIRAPSPPTPAATEEHGGPSDPPPPAPSDRPHPSPGSPPTPSSGPPGPGNEVLPSARVRLPSPPPLHGFPDPLPSPCAAPTPLPPLQEPTDARREGAEASRRAPLAQAQEAERLLVERALEEARRAHMAEEGAAARERVRLHAALEERRREVCVRGACLPDDV